MSIDKDFEDFFRDRLEGLEETPPANGWEKIRADIKPWYKKVNWLAAAALLLFLPALVYFTLQVANRSEEKMAVDSARKDALPEGEKAVVAKMKKPAIQNEDQVEPAANAIAKANIPASKSADGSTAESSFPDANPTVLKKGVKRPATLTAPAVAGLVKTSGNEDQPESNVASITSKSTKTRNSRKAAVAGLAVAASLTKTQKPTTTKAAKTINATEITSEAGVSRQAIGQNHPEQPAGSEVAKQNQGFLPNGEISLLNLRGFASTAFTLPQTLPLLAQPETAEEPVKPALALWSLSGYVSPRSTFSKYSANHTDDKLIQEMSKTNNSLSDVLSYETGLTLHRAVSERFSVDAGLVYTALKDEVHYLITTGEVKNFGIKSISPQDAQIVVNFNFYNESLKTRYSYTGLKLGSTFTLAQKEKTRFYVSGGGTLQFLVSSRTEVYRNEQLVSTSLTNLSDNPMQKLNGQVYGNFGFSRNFDRNWYVFAEPGFGYFLGSAFRKNEVLQLKPVTFGFNFGFRHTL